MAAELNEQKYYRDTDSEKAAGQLTLMRLLLKIRALVKLYSKRRALGVNYRFQKLTSTELTMASPASPMLARAKPNIREKVMIPRMFIFTAARATFSGNIFRMTPNNALNGDSGSRLI